MEKSSDTVSNDAIIDGVIANDAIVKPLSLFNRTAIISKTFEHL